MKYSIVLLLLSVCISTMAQTIQDFSLVNAGDGKEVSLNSFSNSKAIALIFTSNECAYDNQYRGRIKSLSERYKGTIQFLLVNSYTEPRESIKAMSQKLTEWQLSIPYLADKDQVAMERLRAKKSPEAFLVTKKDKGFSIIYNGAIDDNPLVNTDVDNSFLKIAIDQFLSGKKIEVPTHRVTGCTIRKK